MKTSKRRAKQNPFHAHMDEASINSILEEADASDLTTPSLSVSQDSYSIVLLNELDKKMCHSISLIRQHMKQKDKLCDPSYIQRCWDGLAMDLYHSEQLLWEICDASWLRRNDLLCRLTSYKHLAADDYIVQEHGTATIVKCPHLAIQNNLQVMLNEDMLMSKLAHTPNLRKYGTAHVSFYHVYPVVSSVIPKDVGNYHYRRIIDVLAVFFGFSDSAYSYSMMLSALFTDTIPEGTYILIEGKKNDSNILEILESHFSSKS